MQHTIHTAVQENNFYIRETMCLGVRLLKSLEENYPGLKDMLKKRQVSLLNLKISTHLELPLTREENKQLIDAKTAGGVKAFSTKEESVLKWCLNRSEQAKNTRALEDLCNIRADSGVSLADLLRF